mgnify:FL=1
MPITVSSLNKAGIADYMFSAVDGHSVQINRTQAGELLSDIDSFEDELRRYYHSADRTIAIIEGIIADKPLIFSKKLYKFSEKSGAYALDGVSSITDISIRPRGSPGKLYSYSVTATGFVHGMREYNISNKMFSAWLLQLDMAGITVVYTTDLEDTATKIVSFYGNLQKPEHATLQRYLKPKIQIRDLNPHISALINLSQSYKLDIGEVKATALIDKFGSLLNTLLADVSELCEVEGIGEKTARKLIELPTKVWRGKDD